MRHSVDTHKEHSTAAVLMQVAPSRGFLALFRYLDGPPNMVRSIQYLSQLGDFNLNSLHVYLRLRVTCPLSSRCTSIAHVARSSKADLSRHRGMGFRLLGDRYPVRICARAFCMDRMHRPRAR
ncbi:hypothetical protein IG631_08977 [Alternaria alternata]|nr:hypothetical protein IG631_08977 [Alternaria alternata]